MFKKMKKPIICASIMASTIEEFIRKINKVNNADIVEIRADGLRTNNYKSEVKRLLKTLKIQRDIPMILTLRSEKEGGAFLGSESERIETIIEAMKLADAVDIELRAKDRDKVLEEARKNKVPVIISYHDFNATPKLDVLRSIIEEEISLGADLAKVAVTVKSKRDVLKLIEVTEEYSKQETPLATMGMGDLGKFARIACVFFGSAMVYASVAEPTASGQLSIEDTVDLLRKLGILEK